MPNGLLPSKRLQPESQESPQSNSILPDANLLQRREFFKKERDLRRAMISTYQVVILVVCSVTILLLAVNAYYSSKLNVLNDKKNTLMSELISNEDALKEGRLIEYQVDSYKNVLKSRKKLTIPIEKIFMGITPPVELLVFRTNSEKFEATVRSSTPDGIVRVLYDLLHNGDIKTVSLQAVNLDTDTNIYRVQLTGYYK